LIHESFKRLSYGQTFNDLQDNSFNDLTFKVKFNIFCIEDQKVLRDFLTNSKARIGLRSFIEVLLKRNFGVDQSLS